MVIEMSMCATKLLHETNESTSQCICSTNEMNGKSPPMEEFVAEFRDYDTKNVNTLKEIMERNSGGITMLIASLTKKPHFHNVAVKNNKLRVKETPYLQDDGYLLLPWFGRLPLPVGV